MPTKKISLEEEAKKYSKQKAVNKTALRAYTAAALTGLLAYGAMGRKEEVIELAKTWGRLMAEAEE